MATKQTTLKQYDELAAQLIARVQSEVKPFPEGQNSEKAKAERIKKSKHDLLYFCDTYLSHHFTNPWEKGHKQIAKTATIWDKILMARGFRGLGKSTLVNTGRALQVIAHKETDFILFLADDDDAAEMNALAVKVELEYNPKLRNDFGNMKGEKWEASEFITAHGVKVLCKSHRSFKRGARFGSIRPGMAFCDDFDTLTNTINQEQIDKRVEFVYGELIPAMHNKPWQVYFCCNKVARNDTGTQLSSNSETVVVDIPAEDEKTGRPTHPKSFPRAKLDKMKKVLGTVRYNREFKLKIVSGEDDDFQEDWFVMIDKPEPHYKFRISFLDPSVGASRKNDTKAIITLGFTHKHVDVMHAWIRRTTIDKMCRASFEQYKRFDWHRMGVESNGFQILLKDKFKELGREYRFQMPIKMINTSDNKNARIMSLQPGIETGYFRFVRGAGDMQKLIDQFLGFNSQTTKNEDDGPDGMAMAWKLLKQMAGITNEVNAEIID